LKAADANAMIEIAGQKEKYCATLFSFSELSLEGTDARIGRYGSRFLRPCFVGM
jgi:hypothetical protein